MEVLDFQHDTVSGSRGCSSWSSSTARSSAYVLKREKTLPPERLVRMLSQVAIGLDEAHAREFIHRDLKPDNIFLCGTREGDVVKLLDFGMREGQERSNAKKLTVLGTTIGSPYYMAPEQAQGLDTLDARADVFALAAITYECVTGKVPFDGTNGPSILLAIMTKEPEPPSVEGAGAKYPVAAGARRGASRRRSRRTRTSARRRVGALADAVGARTGSTGDHRQWATCRSGARGADRRGHAAPLGGEGRPARRVVGGPVRGAAGPWQGGAAMPPEQGMEQAFAAVREADLAAAGRSDGQTGLAVARSSSACWRSSWAAR